MRRLERIAVHAAIYGPMLVASAYLQLAPGYWVLALFSALIVAAASTVAYYDGVSDGLDGRAAQRGGQ